jgi:hypothetical protein
VNRGAHTSFWSRLRSVSLDSSACSFHLREGEYLLDGEYDLGRQFLIRRTIILLDMAFLQKRYEDERSLGIQLSDETSGEGKRLGPIPREYFEIFGDDLEMRESRLKRVEDRLAQPHLRSWERASLQTEAGRLRAWRSAFAERFLDAETGPLAPPLSDLCQSPGGASSWCSPEASATRYPHLCRHSAVSIALNLTPFPLPV